MIESVIFFFSGSGMVMLFILFMRINVVGSKSKLVKHRSKEPGFVDLLIYASVVDGWPSCILEVPAIHRNACFFAFHPP